MHFTAFDTREGLAQWLAETVASALRKSISRRETASLAVSGGSTPKLFFQHLSRQVLDWDKVTVTLVDERWVPGNSDRSNARLVAIELLQRDAARASFLPLYRPELTPETIGEIEDEISPLLPFSAVVLGMGADGHTASFFPGGKNLEAAVKPDTQRLVIGTEAEGAGEPRVTLTLPPLVNAENTFLHIEGQQKRDVLEEASGAGDPAAMPIRFVLAALPDIRVVWAP